MTRIVERAGGNPFFVEEIVRHLVDRRGARILRAGEALARGRSRPSRSPTPCRPCSAARIDLLGPGREAGPAGGRGRRPHLLAGAGGRYLDVAPSARRTSCCAGSSRATWCSCASTPRMRGQPEYIFKHALVRDVAYESIPKRDRAMAHLRGRRWIEEAAGERRRRVRRAPGAPLHGGTAGGGMGDASSRTGARRSAPGPWSSCSTPPTRQARLFAIDRATERVTTGLELAQGPIERARGLEGLEAACCGRTTATAPGGRHGKRSTFGWSAAGPV